MAAATPTPKDVVKIVPGSTGNCEHNHDEYWDPVSPLKLRSADLENGQHLSLLNEKKVVQRKLRKPDNQILGNTGGKRGNSKNASVGFNIREHSYQHFQDQYIEVFSITELRQLLKVNREVLRKNHYQHMHARPAVAEETTISATASEDKTHTKQSTTAHRYENNEQKSSRMQDVHSELQVRHNSTTEQYQPQVVGTGKTRALARNVISSKDQVRGGGQRKQLIEQSSDSYKNNYTNAMNNTNFEQPSSSQDASEISVRQFRKITN